MQVKEQINSIPELNHTNDFPFEKMKAPLFGGPVNTNKRSILSMNMIQSLLQIQILFY